MPKIDRLPRRTLSAYVTALRPIQRQTGHVQAMSGNTWRFCGSHADNAGVPRTGRDVRSAAPRLIFAQWNGETRESMSILIISMMLSMTDPGVRADLCGVVGICQRQEDAGCDIWVGHRPLHIWRISVIGVKAAQGITSHLQYLPHRAIQHLY